MASLVPKHFATSLRAGALAGQTPIWQPKSRLTRLDFSRTYTASAQKPASNLRSASNPKTNAKKAAKPQQTVLSDASKQEPLAATATTPGNSQTKDVSEMTEEEKLDQLKNLAWYMQRFPTLDLWGQKSDKLGKHISVTFTNFRFFIPSIHSSLNTLNAHV
jgi:hypothetical protein